MEAMNHNINEAAYQATAYQTGHEMIFAFVIMCLLMTAIIGVGYLVIHVIKKNDIFRKKPVVQPIRPNIRRIPRYPRRKR
ncbi:MAG: hypothetical protein GWP15_03225 [Nitrospirae bacterium]|nr:hypothetical protein [Nitrospirota bacterium]